MRDFLEWNDAEHPNDNDIETLDARMWEFANSPNGSSISSRIGFEFSSGEPRLQYVFMNFLSQFGDFEPREDFVRWRRDWDSAYRP